MSYHDLSDKEIYECLAKDTPESLNKALDGCPKSMEGIVFRAIARSEYSTPEMMKKMIFETQFGFTKLEYDYGTKEMVELSSSPRRDEKEVGDIHNFRSEAVARMKEFVKSPSIHGNEVDAYELLYKIAANIPGNPRDVLDVFKTAVNSPYANDTTVGYVAYRTDFLLPHREGEEACKDYTKDALDVFATIADPKNEYKISEEGINDFYNAIIGFASYDPKRVTALVNDMKKSRKNTDKTLATANRVLLAATKSKTVANETQRA